MKVKIYKVFLASPGDTARERKMAENVVSELNQTHGEPNNFRIELLKWENNTRPDFGNDGQDVINTQIGDDYHIFVGVMWTRFGTPTNRAESGTEEEFERAYKRFKEKGDVKIMFYFNSSPIPQEKLDLKQLQKVADFKDKIKALGAYYWHYDTTPSFEKTLRIHLGKTLSELNSKITTSPIKPVETEVTPKIRESFSTYLNDIEANFAHSRVDKLLLSDVYIAPDLKDIHDSKKNIAYKAENLSDLSDAIDADGTKFILIGNELAGKTAACKYLFKKYFDLGLFPVLVNGGEINNNIRPEAIVKIVENKISDQYELGFNLKDFSKDKFVLIVDDFHKSAKGKSKYWPTLIKNIECTFEHVILTGNTLMPIEDISKHEAFKNFDIYAILEFGPKFRFELVNNWNKLGISESTLDQNELLRKNDVAIAHIKTIIGKNYIPSYPFFLLTILQAMESGSIQNPNYSIHGFYYELLINDGFKKAIKDEKEISLYYNYLTFLCYHLFENNTKEISFQDMEGFHKAYCDKYDLSYRLETILETFSKAKLLHLDGKVHLKEPYVYYFFVAKYIANNISKPEIKNVITRMSLRMFKDEYASIIMFVTHLSKDEYIINELIKNANSIFPEIPSAKLEEDIQGINDLITDIPKQVLELVDVKEKRNEELQEQEETEKAEKEFEKETKDYDHISLNDDISSVDFYAKLTLALKTIDILGQVTKKHWGELDGQQKLNLVLSTYNLGLRTLNGYLQYFQKNKKEIIEAVKELIIEKHIKDRFDLKQNIDEAAHKYVFKHSFLASWGITKRISLSIGYDKLKNTFEKALAAQTTNSVKLIDFAIKLGYAGIPMDLVKKYGKEMDSNKLSMLVFQNLLIDHCYMFDTDHEEKSQLSAHAHIEIKQQMKIDATSKVKKRKKTKV